MNKITSFIVGSIAVLSLIVGVGAYNKHIPAQLGAQGAQGEKGATGARGPAGSEGARGATGAQGPAGVSAPRLGSLTSPDITSPYMSVNGITSWYARIDLTNAVAATTSPCFIQTPNATTTLENSDLNVKTSSTTATTWFLVNASTRTVFVGATTSVASSFSLASGAVGSFTYSATSTNANGIADHGIFAPNTYLAWYMIGSAAADTTKFNGTCQAKFRQI